MDPFAKISPTSIRFIIFVLCFGMSAHGQAQGSTSGSVEGYGKITVTATARAEEAGTPLAFFKELDRTKSPVQVFWSTKNTLAAEAVDLLRYFKQKIFDPDETVPRYNRREHFGGWVNADAPEDCYDTRAEVMLRDLKPGVQATFREQSKCSVSAGAWLDPYTGEEFRDANEVQIDHVVPLKNAFDAGAHAWDKARRCHFANYMNSGYHLRTVNGRENMSKGGKGPEFYMPPNTEFACSYLNEWMRIKAVWELSVTSQEFEALTRLLEEHRCPANAATMPTAELRRERKASKEPVAACNETRQ